MNDGKLHLNNTTLLSNLHFYSIGIVTENKERESDKIKVCPIEYLQMVDGAINEYLETIVATSVDRNDIPVVKTIDEEWTITARWLSFGEMNRFSPPDMIVGDTVLLFRYGDSEVYYWTKIHTEGTIRRLETVKYVYSNTPEPLTPLNPDNTYWYTVSTHDKFIHLHTSDNDGEHTTYDVKINTEEGWLHIWDGKGNFIKFNSMDNDLIIHFNRDVEINAERDMRLNIGRDLLFRVGGNWVTQVAGNVSFSIGGSAYGFGGSVGAQITSTTPGAVRQEVNTIINEFKSTTPNGFSTTGTVEDSRLSECNTSGKVVIDICSNVYARVKGHVYTSCEKDVHLDIGNDHLYLVGNDHIETIGNDKKVKILNNKIENIGNNYNISIGASYTNNTADNYTVTVGNAITFNTQNFTTNAPKIVLNGEVEVTKNLRVAQNTYSSNFNSYSGASIGSSATIPGNATIGGIDFLNHVHSDTFSGDTSPPKNG